MSLCSVPAGDGARYPRQRPGAAGRRKPEEVDWQDNGLEGKLDLVGRWTSVCRAPVSIPTSFCRRDLVRKRRHEYFGYASVYSPASAAVDPAWEAKSDWEIYKATRRNSPKCALVIWVKKLTSSAAYPARLCR